MAFPIELCGIFTENNSPLTIYNGMLTLLGANGTGKTHLLRNIKDTLADYSIINIKSKHIKLFSAGRISPLEEYRSTLRSNPNVHNGISKAEYDKPAFGVEPEVKALYEDEALDTIFHQLVNKPDLRIKIQERLAKLFKKSLYIEWKQSSLQIKFADIGADQNYYPTGKEASGLLHLIGLLIAVYDDTISVLLIDEPEVSLHPQLQAFLLKEIKGVIGVPKENSNKKIVIIATHSTEMLNIQSHKDICNLVFCTGYQQKPIQIESKQKILDGKNIQAAILEIGQRNKQIFFCKTPLLVEGRSDQIICEAIADKSNIFLEAAGVQALSIEGISKNFPIYKFLKLLNKKPIMLIDADAVADNSQLLTGFIEENKQNIETFDINSGQETIPKRIKSIYNDFSKFVEGNVDTISQLSKDYIYYNYYSKPIPKDKNKEKNTTTLINKRLGFCLLFNLEESSKLDSSFTQVKNRFNKLLKDLEQFGLFVLKKGTIESYYQKEDYDSEKSKISMAMNEALYILDDLQQSDLQHQPYDDIRNCIVYSANTLPICEATLIKEWLSSFVYVLHGLMAKNDIKNYKSKVRELIGDKADLFSIEKKDNLLNIDINTFILDITGFPIQITENDDANSITRKIEEISSKHDLIIS